VIKDSLMQCGVAVVVGTGRQITQSQSHSLSFETLHPARRTPVGGRDIVGGTISTRMKMAGPGLPLSLQGKALSKELLLSFSKLGTEFAWERRRGRGRDWSDAHRGSTCLSSKPSTYRV
jgi:hypothetical protein